MPTSPFRPAARLSTQASAVVLLAVGGCTNHQHAADSSGGANSQQPTILPAAAAQQTTFASPELAIRELIRASRRQDLAALSAMLGANSVDVVYSGDAVADRNARNGFARAYDAYHGLVANADGTQTLEIGVDHWPMPIPLVKDADGQWRFDTARGRDEILNRRIGANELAAIQVCRAIVDAQQEYAMADADRDGIPAYAERFASHPQKKDGLYWPVGPNEKPSPLGALFADAADEGYSTTQTAIGPRRPYHGYFYRIVKAQSALAEGGARNYIVDGHMIGGFGVVAWPADYGNSGVMTFIVNQQGIVYQRNLGDQTSQIARAMTMFDPAAGWTRCDPAKK